MAKYRYHHIHLASCEPSKTLEFYEKVLGAKRDRVMQLADGRSVTFLSLNGAAILITSSAAKDSPAGLDHFGLITDNIEEAVAELKANGINFRDEIREIPGGKYAFFWAPENVLVELMEMNG